MLWVGGEPRKTAGPTLRGVARSRTLQEGPGQSKISGVQCHGANSSFQWDPS